MQGLIQSEQCAPSSPAAGPKPAHPPPSPSSKPPWATKGWMGTATSHVDPASMACPGTKDLGCPHRIGRFVSPCPTPWWLLGESVLSPPMAPADDFTDCMALIEEQLQECKGLAGPAPD